VKADHVNAVATSGIFFITLIAAMVGFYYNFQSAEMKLGLIIIFEIVFILVTGLIIRWLKKEVQKHEHY